MNKAASNGRTLPEMTARATSKAARKARNAGARGASIPYEPRRRGLTRLVIRIAFSSRVFHHSDEAAVPHDPTAVSRLSHESRRLPCAPYPFKAPKRRKRSTEIRDPETEKSCAQCARLSPLRCLFSPPTDDRYPGRRSVPQ